MPRPPRRPTPLFLALSLAGLVAPVAVAAPPADDWTIETQRDDALLVDQRFGRLRRDPFDRGQWRALEKAIGRNGLERKIERAAARAPRDVGLQILLARVELRREQPRAAATRLAGIEADAPRWRARVFDLRIDALEAAHAWEDAIGALTTEAERQPRDAGAHLLRAHKLADRAGLDDERLRLAQRLADASPTDVDAQVRLARAATSAGATERADTAWAAAGRHARGARRHDLVAERARALAQARRWSDASDLIWGLVENPSTGAGHQRDAWWELLEATHRSGATSERLAARLDRWLEDGRHAKDGAAWRALARALEAAGHDPIPAWRKAVALSARDSEARASLIAALENAGRPEDALAEYRELPGRSDEDVQLGLEMATRLITNGETETGMQIAAEIESRASRSSNALLLLLDFYNNQGEHGEALRVARRLVAVRGRDADARVALGEQLFEMGMHDEAQAQWARLPDLVRPRHKGLARHAQILAEHARQNSAFAGKARAQIELALRSKPNQPEYLRLLATLQEEALQYADAVRSWQRVREQAKAPQHEMIRREARTRIVDLLHRGRGLAAVRGDMERAAKDVLADADPATALDAGLFLAALYRRGNEPRALVVAVHRELLRVYPESAQRYLDLARAQREDGRSRDALGTLRDGADLDTSRRVDFLTLISELEFELGNEEEAKLAAMQAAALGSDGTQALLQLGEMHQRGGDIDDAEAAFRAALANDPRHTRVRSRLAELQLTRGDLEGAGETYRGLLDAGGDVDSMREAGRRALDLAEATGTMAAVLDLAVKRTKREPGADEPREFLLDTLDRVEPTVVRGWLTPRDALDVDRANALRAPLVTALARGSVRTRERAAAHLGDLALPNTGPALARLGAKLKAPDGTSAMKARYRDTRVTAILAAGELADPEATELLAEIAGRHDERERDAAAWALSRTDDPGARDVLLEGLGRDWTYATTTTALACLGVARSVEPAQRKRAINAVERAAEVTGADLVRRACSLARVRLTPDHRLAELYPSLDHRDPLIAGMVAWRIGRAPANRVDDDALQTMFAIALGPAGPRRDATRAALGVLLGPSRANDQPVPPSPEATRRRGGDHRAWEPVIERWMTEQIAPTPAPLSADALRRHRDHLMGALARLAAGTRAERAAAAAAVDENGRLIAPGFADAPISLPSR